MHVPQLSKHGCAASVSVLIWILLTKPCIHPLQPVAGVCCVCVGCTVLPASRQRLHADISKGIGRPSAPHPLSQGTARDFKRNIFYAEMMGTQGSLGNTPAAMCTPVFMQARLSAGNDGLDIQLALTALANLCVSKWGQVRHILLVLHQCQQFRGFHAAHSQFCHPT